MKVENFDNYSYRLSCGHRIWHWDIKNVRRSEWISVALGHNRRKNSTHFSTDEVFKVGDYFMCDECVRLYSHNMPTGLRVSESLIKKIIKGENMSWDGKKFWIIIREDGLLVRDGGKFTKATLYDSKESAEDEAKNLTVKERNIFLVLETVSGFKPPMDVDPVTFKK